MQNIIILALAMLAVASAQTYTYCGNATQGGAECTGENDCGGIDAGVCVGGVCVCNEGYYDADCSYKARDSYTAGLVGLTLLAGVGGVTALYLGNLTWGITQLILTVAPGILACVLSCCGIQLGNIIHTLTLAMWLWALSTTIIFGARTLDYSACDGNGYPIINNVNGAY
ncbi:hypothetical protein F-VV10_0246 [Faustovirus]|nr:hypothetical protein F-VV10_0246 [Faustovirus]